MLEDLYRLLRAGHVQAQGVVDTMTQPVVVLDQSLNISTANNAFLKTFRVERDDVLGKAFFALGNGQWDIADLRALFAMIIPKTQAVVGYQINHNFPHIGQRTFLVDARRLIHPDDNSTSILVLLDDATERQRQDAEKDIVLSEIRHRMRNLFAVIRSLAMQTKVDGFSAAQYRDRFLSRLEGTLRAQEIASTSEPMAFRSLISEAVGETAGARLHCDGPAVTIGAPQLVSLSMVFHELATNSLKYGALSGSDGNVSVTWSIDAESSVEKILRCTWSESGGPATAPPQHKGFGTELIKRTVSHLGGSVELEYWFQGLVAVMSFPVSHDETPLG